MWTLLLVTVSAVAFGQVELVLFDGSVLQGTEVRRDRGDYVLELESGIEIVLPPGLVEAVRLTGTEEKPRRTESGLTVGGEPGTLAGEPEPEGPSGIRVAEPETLAGRPVDPPTPSEQLDVFGDAPSFQQDVVDSGWTPESDWEMDTANNDFNPSTWAQGPIDSSWEPKSAWESDRNVMKSGRSSWQKSVVDSNWAPSDGFSRDD
jgi:hypothetical protein